MNPRGAPRGCLPPRSCEGRVSVPAPAGTSGATHGRGTAAGTSRSSEPAERDGGDREPRAPAGPPLPAGCPGQQQPPAGRGWEAGAEHPGRAGSCPGSTCTLQDAARAAERETKAAPQLPKRREHGTGSGRPLLTCSSTWSEARRRC